MPVLHDRGGVKIQPQVGQARPVRHAEVSGSEKVGIANNANEKPLRQLDEGFMTVR